MVELIKANDMLFAIGPAGSGKTYTAVALAVRALKEREVKRIVLTRPAVEAGENLGFLPGDLKEKLDPYLQPLYDALMDMIPYEKLAEYMEKGVIEIAPLAFMRGRTLDKAFVILDEAQNATVTQMKMFLTRMGMSAKFVITGDATQIDLPRNQTSGLLRSVNLLRDVEGIGIVEMTGSDVIRHPLVKKVIDAFELSESESKRDTRS
jgi:phosphate starvation-inducible PhoH-like protein